MKKEEGVNLGSSLLQSTDQCDYAGPTAMGMKFTVFGNGWKEEKAGTISIFCGWIAASNPVLLCCVRMEVVVSHVEQSLGHL